jgi:hypothetical protein
MNGIGLSEDFFLLYLKVQNVVLCCVVLCVKYCRLSHRYEIAPYRCMYPSIKLINIFYPRMPIGKSIKNGAKRTADAKILYE